MEERQEKQKEEVTGHFGTNATATAFLITIPYPMLPIIEKFSQNYVAILMLL
jgi:hypothetical protein